MAPSVAQGGKFPVISHPLSRLGSRESLSVCGAGQFRDGSLSAEPRLNLYTPIDIGNNRSSVKRCTTSQDSRRATTEEVLVLLQEKVASNIPAARKIFRANDPNGEGVVPKEAFSRVMWLLYGYLTTRQIQAVLKRLGLEKKECISFEEFYARVKNHGMQNSPFKTVSNWVRSVNSAIGSNDNDRPSLPPSTPRSARSARGSRKAPGDSATLCWNSLKKKMQNEEFDPTSVFPIVCFGDGAFVVPAQLREALRKLSIEATEDDIAKIYRGMEGASPYAVHSRRLFELLGLDPDTGRYMPQKQDPVQKITKPLDAPQQLTISPPDNKLSDGSVEPEVKRPRTSQGCRRDDRAQSAARPRTSFDGANIFEGDVAMLISKKLEDGQSHLLHAMQARDPQGRGEITKADLRFAFTYLGIPVKATDMEHFLVRNGLRRKDHRVNYKLLMRRLQTRSNRGLLHKVMKNIEHTFHRDTAPHINPEGVSAATLEAVLLDLFQKEFLELLALIKMRDIADSGLISLTNLRDALQIRFNLVFTDGCWDAFVSSPFVKPCPPPAGASDKELYVAYNDFLSKFDVMIRPATADEDDPWLQSNIDNEYAHLYEHKRRYLQGMGADPANHTLRHDPRPIEELEKVMVDVFLNKFYTMKKEYDMIVREDLCRVDKEKFDYVMFRCGFILTASELSRLWLSMPITRPIESMSFPNLLRHVIKLHYSASKSGRFTRSSTDVEITSFIMNKMRQQVTSHWGLLKKKLRFLDPMGTSRIPKEDMLEIIQGLQPRVTELELYYMIEMLESRIPGKTNYFRFMEFFTKPFSRHSLRSHNTPSQPTSEPALSDTTSVIALRPGPPPVPTRQHNFEYKRKPRSPFVSIRNAPATPVFKTVTRHDLLKRGPKLYPHRYDKENAIRAGFDKPAPNLKISMEEAKRIYRANVAGLVRHPPSVASTVPLSEPPTFKQIPPKQIPALRRSLRAADVEHRGKLPVNTFRRILQDYGVEFKDPNELYDFLRHYDTKLSDKVSYERFLQNMIGTF